jgi:predicted acylesterase/phospholipase RssA
MANQHPVPRRNKPNKVSTARVERAIKEGKKLPPEELLRNADNCRVMVMRFHPKMMVEGRDEPIDNPDHDPQQYSHWLTMEREALKAAAPYYSPRLHAIAMATASVTAATEVERVDPRVTMFEKYMEMRRRGEIAKDITPRKKEPVLIDAVPQKERKGNGPDPDDADGVAV